MKKTVVIVGGLAVVVLGTLFLVWSNLDGLVKGAIQSFGSEATKTRVTVSDVKLSLETGKARISGLNVSNLDGFSDPNIFELGMISIKIDTSTLNQNPIVIDEIIISAPSVIYEINKSGTSNVEVLKSNLAQSAGSSADSGGSGSGGDELPFQPVDATQALNLSAGVSKFNVFLGRSFSCLATASNFDCE
jgi:hypothetical protein